MINHTCKPSDVWKRVTRIIIARIIYHTERIHKRKCQTRPHHLTDPPTKTICSHTSEYSKWAEPWHEQYSRDAAREDEIADQLEQLYDQQ